MWRYTRMKRFAVLRLNLDYFLQLFARWVAFMLYCITLGAFVKRFAFTWNDGAWKTVSKSIPTTQTHTHTVYINKTSEWFFYYTIYCRFCGSSPNQCCHGLTMPAPTRHTDDETAANPYHHQLGRSLGFLNHSLQSVMHKLDLIKNSPKTRVQNFKPSRDGWQRQIKPLASYGW